MFGRNKSPQQDKQESSKPPSPPYLGQPTFPPGTTPSFQQPYSQSYAPPPTAPVATTPAESPYVGESGHLSPGTIARKYGGRSGQGGGGWLKLAVLGLIAAVIALSIAVVILLNEDDSLPEVAVTVIAPSQAAGPNTAEPTPDSVTAIAVVPSEVPSEVVPTEPTTEPAAEPSEATAITPSPEVSVSTTDVVTPAPADESVAAGGAGITNPSPTALELTITAGAKAFVGSNTTVPITIQASDPVQPAGQTVELQVDNGAISPTTITFDASGAALAAFVSDPAQTSANLTATVIGADGTRGEPIVNTIEFVTEELSFEKEIGVQTIVIEDGINYIDIAVNITFVSVDYAEDKTSRSYPIKIKHPSIGLVYFDQGNGRKESSLDTPLEASLSPGQSLLIYYRVVASEIETKTQVNLVVSKGISNRTIQLTVELPDLTEAVSIPTNTPAAEVNQALTETPAVVCRLKVVNAAGLNVRSGSGTNYQFLFSLNLGLEVIASARSSATSPWYHITKDQNPDIGGQSEALGGWISGGSSFVSVVEGSEDACNALPIEASPRPPAPSSGQGAAPEVPTEDTQNNPVGDGSPG